MTPASTEFRGIVAIDKDMIGKMQTFLDDRELQAVANIQEAYDQVFYEVGLDSDKLELRNLTELTARLTHRLDSVEITQPLSSATVKEHVALLQERTNTALWSYLELLEGGATELFQQLDQQSIESWDNEFAKVFESLVGLLKNHMLNLIQAIDALEKLLWKLQDCLKGRKQAGISWLSYIWSLGHFLLDRELIPTARKAKRFLLVRFRGWQDRYAQYIKFNTRAVESLEKLSDYSILAQQSLQAQQNFKLIYRLLKIWEIDAKSKGILLNDLLRVLRRTISGDQALILYENYYSDIREALFQTSRSIKEIDALERCSNESALSQNLQATRRELNTLSRSLARYREFLLRTDPNPYVRSRWGFAEWVVGPEPETCKGLLRLELRTEGTDLLFGRMIDSLQTPRPVDNAPMEASLYPELQKVLHAIGQPLNSRHLMINQGERLADVLYRFNELGSTNPEAVNIVGEVMAQALRADWKHHVLNENQKFIELYRVHRELVKSDLQEPQFQKIRERLLQEAARLVKWTERGTVEKHRREVERLQEELASYLEIRLGEDLMAHTEANQLHRLRHQLLDLRFCLGNFYHRLFKASSEGALVKLQFRAVDQALDTLDNRFAELGYATAVLTGE